MTQFNIATTEKDKINTQHYIATAGLEESYESISNSYNITRSIILLNIAKTVKVYHCGSSVSSEEAYFPRLHLGK